MIGIKFSLILPIVLGQDVLLEEDSLSLDLDTYQVGFADYQCTDHLMGSLTAFFCPDLEFVVKTQDLFNNDYSLTHIIELIWDDVEV